MTPSEVLEALVASEVSKALGDLEAALGEDSMTMTSLEAAVEVSQEVELQSRLQQSSKMERESLRLRRLISTQTEIKRLK